MAPKTFERTIHSEGHTTICYTPDGRRIVTGGTDNYVRIFDSRDEQKDPATVDHCTDCINSLTATDTHIIVGTEDNFGICFNSKTLQFERNLIRRTMPIRQISVNKDATMAAIALDELEIRIVSLEDPTQSTALKGHSRQVLSIEFDPKGRYLASASCDGSVKIWEHKSDEWICKTTLDLNSQITELQPEVLLRLSWHPEGSHLAICGPKGLKILQRETWKEVQGYSDDLATQPISLTAFSSDGSLLACSDLTGALIVSRFPSGGLLQKYRHKSRVTGIAWSPQGSNLAAVDNLGWLTVRHDLAPPNEKMSAKEAANDALRASLGLDDHDSADGEEGKPRKRLGKKALQDDDEASENGDVADEFIPEEVEGRGEDLDDFIVDDERTEFTSAPLVAQMQKAFQPSATPVELKRRFLVWNSVGFITTRNEQSHHTIDIEFHDRSTHRPVHFTDHYAFSLAALNERAAVFASAPQGSSTSSTVFFRPFESWASNGEWSLTLEAGESAKALAIGASWVALVTSANYIRVFSFSGLPLLISSLEGDVVAVSGMADVLFAIFHQGAPINGEQCLGYTLVEVPKKATLAKGRLPLTKGAHAAWMGFSEAGIPGVYDSSGILRGLVMQWGFQWVPLHQMSLVRKEKQEHHWVVGFSDVDVSCIVTKGAEKFPSVFPCPVITCLPLRMPLLNLDSQIGASEEEYLRNEVNLAHAQWDLSQQGSFDPTDDDLVELQKKSDRNLLGLLQAACKTDKSMRALEIFSLLTLPKSQDAALMIASKFNLSALVDRMTLLHQAKLREKARFEELASPPKAISVERLPVSMETTPFIPAPITKSSAKGSFLEKESSHAKSLSLSMSESNDAADDVEERSDSEDTENPFGTKKVGPPAAKYNPFAKKGAGQKRAFSSTDLGVESKDTNTKGASREATKPAKKPRTPKEKPQTEKGKEKDKDREKIKDAEDTNSNGGDALEGRESKEEGSVDAIMADSTGDDVVPQVPTAAVAKKGQPTLAAFSFMKKKPVSSEAAE